MAITKERTEKEQLRVAFRVILKDMMDKFGILTSPNGDVERIIINETNILLLKEVSIRTPLR